MQSQNPRQVFCYDCKEELELLIKQHNELYYNQNNPTISDYEYDKLVEELKTLDPQSKTLSYLGNAVFGQKVTHTLPMGSLLKCHSKDAISKLGWNHRWYSGNINQFASFVAMPKIDGVSMCITYINGKLQSALTRGSGYEGEDVTFNAMEIKNIPKQINSNESARIEIRGEVYVDTDWFLRNHSIYSGQGTFKNPRNYAGGSLKQKDPTITRKRNLRFVAYRVIFPSCSAFMNNPATDVWTDNITLSKEKELEWLKTHQFEIPTYQICHSEDKIQEIIDWFTNSRKSFHFDTDGIVFWINDRQDFLKQGFSGVTPNGALAYKFNTEKIFTKVKDIEWKTSRTGRVIPVMIVEAVTLAGTTVQRVTLNNLNYLQFHDIQIGDHVEIEKANEIIPKLVSSKPGEVRIPKVPKHCPYCNSSLNIAGVDLVCRSSNCGAQILSKLTYFIKSLNIEGFSGTSIEKIIESGLLEEKDLFSLTKEDLLKVGFGPKQSSKFVEQLQNIEIKKEDFLKAIGIPGIGRSIWVKALDSIEFDKFVDNTITGEDQIILEKAVGETTSRKIIKGIFENKEFIKRTLPYIKIKSTETHMVGISSIFMGKTFCITGTLSQKRSLIIKQIEDQGGVVSNIGPNTDYLITNDISTNSGKLISARKYGVKIINEHEFRYQLNKGASS